jgi:diguanylate cyclase (GGDEF)-like protein
MGEECFAAERYGRKVSLVMLDLDHFKQLNDSYGHPFGDLVLQGVGELLNTTLRATDAPCRFGGEEFALVLTESDLEAGMAGAERVRRAIADLAFEGKGKPVRVTASFGVACSVSFPKGRLSVGGLLTAADDALYTAKQEGRNRVCSPPDDALLGTP